MLYYAGIVWTERRPNTYTDISNTTQPADCVNKRTGLAHLLTRLQHPGSPLRSLSISRKNQLYEAHLREIKHAAALRYINSDCALATSSTPQEYEPAVQYT